MEKWKQLHGDVAALASSLVHYCDYLSDQCKKMKLNHASATPVHNLADSICVKFVKPCPRDCLPLFDELNQHLERSQMYEHVFLNQFTPHDLRRRYEYLQSLERSGCKFPVVIVTHSAGNNAGNVSFDLASFLYRTTRSRHGPKSEDH